MIQLNDLPIKNLILSSLGQTFNNGAIYDLLAKSGTGKTTLLKTIAGLCNNRVYTMHQRLALVRTIYVQLEASVDGRDVVCS